MDIPFTKEQFFDVFARYNVSVWPMQIILVGLAITVIFSLCLSFPFRNRFFLTILSFLGVWMAVLYHFLFFTKINPAAWFFGTFFLVAGFLFASEGVLKTGSALNLTEDFFPG